MSGTYSYELGGFRPGWLFILEPYSTVLDDSDWHPYLLLTDRVPGGPHGVLAYGSGQETEAKHGTPCATIQPRLGGVGDNALDKPTRFYPVILVQQVHDELPRLTDIVQRGNRLRPRAARVSAADLQAVRELIAPALGLGSGSTARAGATPRSWRGRIVPLSDEYFADTSVRFALVLTAHRDSSAEHYQVLVPIVAGDGKTAPSSVVRATERPWIRVLGPHVQSALVVVPALESVWHHSHIEADDENMPPVFIDPITLHEVEVQVATFFGI
jgi:hypothetical protein